MERTSNKSQHTKLTLEKKILQPLPPGFELAIFRSRPRRSYQQTIPGSSVLKMWKLYTAGCILHNMLKKEQRQYVFSTVICTLKTIVQIEETVLFVCFSSPPPQLLSFLPLSFHPSFFSRALFLLSSSQQQQQQYSSSSRSSGSDHARSSPF